MRTSARTLREPAQPEIRLAVQYAQKLGLHPAVQFPDLIQEQSPAVGRFKQTGLQVLGAAESSFFVAEKLALHQMFRQRGAIDVDERLPRARGIVMNGARDQFLAGAAFARDQYRRIGPRPLWPSRRSDAASRATRLPSSSPEILRNRGSAFALAPRMPSPAGSEAPHRRHTCRPASLRHFRWRIVSMAVTPCSIFCANLLICQC